MNQGRSDKQMEDSYWMVEMAMKCFTIAIGCWLFVKVLDVFI